MRNNNIIIAFILPLILFLGCTKKVITLEVEQDGCDKFKIDGASFNLLTVPCDNDTTQKLTFDVTFDFKGDAACLYLIRVTPEFYDKSNKRMSNVSYESVLKAPNFHIADKKGSFTYDVSFASLEDAKNFNYLILTFHTENVLEDKSPEAKLRINTPCTVITSSMYTQNTDTIIQIPFLANSFSINLWDHAAEDGDRVSVYLNGNWLIDNHSLLNEPGTTFSFSTNLLNKGTNDLVVFALNQGTSGPNTASISVNNGKISNFNPNLETGEAVRIDF